MVSWLSCVFCVSCVSCGAADAWPYVQQGDAFVGVHLQQQLEVDRSLVSPLVASFVATRDSPSAAEVSPSVDHITTTKEDNPSAAAEEAFVATKDSPSVEVVADRIVAATFVVVEDRVVGIVAEEAYPFVATGGIPSAEADHTTATNATATAVVDVPVDAPEHHEVSINF